MADLETDIPDDDLEIEPDVEAPKPEAEAPDPEKIRQAEEEARKYGWRPRGEFDRDPKGWVDADRFLELPATQIKQLRDQLKERDAKFEAAEKARRDDIERLSRTTQTVAERIRQQERERFEQELAGIRAAKRQAAETADVQRFDRLEQHERQVLERAQQTVAEPAAREPAPEIRAYVEQNEWARDPALWAEAVQAVNFMPNMAQATPAQQLAFAEGTMKRKYPHLFAPLSPPPQATPPASRVDGGGLGGGARRGKTAADLPSDVRAVGQGFVKDGTFKNLEEYAAAYFEDN